MSSGRARRTIVLGVDSLDLLLLERWTAAGMLPFFTAQLRDSCLVHLSTPSRVLQGALWPSVLSGRSPGYHGTYFLTQLTNGTYDLDLIRADRVGSPPYYSLLDANGVRCAVVDFPHVTSIKGFKGLHIVDWLAEFQTWQFTVQPRSGRREIERRFGMLRPAGGYGSTPNSLDGHRQLRRKLEASLVMKSMLAKELLERDDLDHICVVFGEAHKAGHFFWKYMDPSHPDHEVVEPYLRDGLLDTYRLLDRHLAELAQRASPRDNLILFSEHGMQPNYRGDHFVMPLLERLGLCGSATGPAQGSPSQPSVTTWRLGPDRSSARTALHALIKRLTPEPVVRKLRRRLGAAARVDWSRTQVFQLPTDRNSFLRVNLRGREPDGIVAPGAEYEALLARIESEFGALTNAETGKPAVEAVVRIHEICPGPRTHELPDVAILWSSEAPLNAVESPRAGRLSLRVREDRTGNHRPGGFLLARGPDIRRQGSPLSGDLLQLPSTLLALHGISPPDYFEMPALDELLVRSVSPESLGAIG